MSRYRHEYKYRIDKCQEEILKIKADGLLSKDPHVEQDGSYFIRSLYFDDLSNTCYYENENGTDPRAKFRIRYYNSDIEKIKLEKKSKKRGMTLKESCSISAEQCQCFMAGLFPEAVGEKQKKLFWEMHLKNLLPKVIVSYERIPYIYQAGNVRITFDKSITASNEISRFLMGDYNRRPILTVGECVMEVKWDEILPQFIKEYMQLDSLQWSTFSKYYLCRKYNMNGGIVG